jgi:hypothetical protein
MPVMERFMSKVEKTDSCWLWTGHIDKTKRGLFCLYGKRHQSSRASYLLHKGDIPAGLYVCHTCDNPRCVNPKHLFLGTHLDNMRDCKEKGRQARGSRHGRARLNESDVLGIFKMVKYRYFEQREVAKHFGVSTALINRILKGEKWSHLTEVTGGLS